MREVRKKTNRSSESEAWWSTGNSSSQPEDGMEPVPIGDTHHTRPNWLQKRLKKARKNVTHFFQDTLSSLGPDDGLLTYEHALATDKAYTRLFRSGSGEPSETSASSSCGSGALLREAGLFQNPNKRAEMGTPLNHQPPSYEDSQAQHPESQREQEVEAIKRQIASRSAYFSRGGFC